MLSHLSVCDTDAVSSVVVHISAVYNLRQQPIRLPAITTRGQKARPRRLGPNVFFRTGTPAQSLKYLIAPIALSVIVIGYCEVPICYRGFFGKFRLLQ